MKKSTNRIYIIGAGFAGASIAAEIRRKGILGQVVAFLDDDREKIGTRIENTPVLGPIDAVIDLLQRTPADEALIAMPGATRERLRQIYLVLLRAGFARIRILPSVAELVDGEAHLIQTREIDPEDLLGRNPVQINLRESLAYLRGRRVVITGAGGSIGSELARQLLSGGAERLYLFDHGENALSEIERELRLLQEEGVGERATVVPVVGELQDRDYMRFILRRLRADVIFHAAAYKHVPMLELYPSEAVKNNVFGTEHLVRAAREAGVKRFVMISTDKVVEPTSVYGASKRIAEQIVLSHNDPEHAFMVVRFGNVLGSTGSIIPLFRKQIMRGGPVTLTHPDVTRYFMTISEAAALVLQAGGVGRPGELYILDMGEPVRIRDLAEQMVRFYGFEPDEDIRIDVVGMRPGEKMHERLFETDERPEPTEHPRLNRVTNAKQLVADLPALLETLRPICFFDPDQPDRYRRRRALRAQLSVHVPSLEAPCDEPEY
ncbi:MAG: polysaccharide biosynthesis protein [Spirochaetota bacterium]